MQYINKFVEEYIKILDLKENPILNKNIKGRTYQEKRKNLNLLNRFNKWNFYICKIKIGKKLNILI